MKCPLFEVAYVLKGPGPETPDSECIEEDCAWWDGKFEDCSILELNRTLYLISEYFEDIRNKMPPKQ